jgi:hypothetical protein
MGATGWSYFVPYQPNLDAALQQLRQHVFTDGMFEGHPDYHKQLLEGLRPFLTSEEIWQSETYIHDLEACLPTSIEHALELCKGSGTHSILDIRTISEQPEFETASPLNPSQLEEIFGTITPTYEQFRQSDILERIHFLRHRNQGAYVILYRDGVPDQIWFGGRSGY